MSSPKKPAGPGQELRGPEQPRGVCREIWEARAKPWAWNTGNKMRGFGLWKYSELSADSKRCLGFAWVANPKSMTRPIQRGMQTPSLQHTPVLPTFSLLFISHWTLERLLKYSVSAYAREFLVFLYPRTQSTSFPAQSTRATVLEHLYPKEQGSRQILSWTIQRSTDSLSNAGNKANLHLNPISSAWRDLDYESAENKRCRYHNILQKG